MAINEVTGQSLVSKYSEAYRSNYDSIFKKVDAALECSHSYPDKSFSEVYPVCVLCGYVDKEVSIH